MAQPNGRMIILVISVVLNGVLLALLGMESKIPAETSVAATAGPGAGDASTAEVSNQIQAMVDRETRAWNHEDVPALLSIFHSDMVWPWPANPQAHDPEGWEIGLGRFDQGRWTAVYRDLFDTFDLVHNHRNTVKIMVSNSGDGAFAVVDIDTLWRDEAGNDFHWKGRVGKGYTLMEDGWKLIFHTGALDYGKESLAFPAGD